MELKELESNDQKKIIKDAIYETKLRIRKEKQKESMKRYRKSEKGMRAMNRARKKYIMKKKMKLNKLKKKKDIQILKNSNEKKDETLGTVGLPIKLICGIKKKNIAISLSKINDIIIFSLSVLAIAIISFIIIFIKSKLI
jgi:hypothetical protein